MTIVKQELIKGFDKLYISEFIPEYKFALICLVEKPW